MNHLLKRSKLLLLISIYLVLVSLFFIYINIQSKREINWWLQNHTDQLNVEFTSAKNAYNLASQTIVQEIINQPKILKCFSQAIGADSIKQHKVRDSLYQYLLPSYKYLRELGIKQLHFHLPDNTSFLRFHRPGKFGDDLTQVRYSVCRANQTQEQYSGFEEGRIYNGFRYVFPLSYKGRHLGTVETSFSFGAIRNQIVQYDKKMVGFMLRKDIVNEKLFDDELKNYEPVLFSDDFVCEKSFKHFNDDSLLLYKLIDEHIRAKVADRLKRFEDFTVYHKCNDQYFLISFNSIKNVEGFPAAYIFSYSKDNVVENFIRQYWFTLIVGFLLITTVFVFIFIDSLKNIKIREQLEMLNLTQKELLKRNDELHYLNRDINLQKEQIAQSEERLQAIVNTSFAGVIIINKNGITLFANPTSFDMLGYQANELKGLHFSSYTHPDDIEKAQKALFDLIGERRRFVDAEIRLLHKVTREVIWVHINGSRYPKINPNDLDSVLLVFQNISNQKETEQQLKELNNTKDRFFSILGHDLKGPIGSVLGLIEYLRTNEKDISKEQLDQVVALMDSSIRNVYKLLENLLAWSRTQTNRIQTEPRFLELHKEIEISVALL